MAPLFDLEPGPAAERNSAEIRLGVQPKIFEIGIHALARIQRLVGDGFQFFALF